MDQGWRAENEKWKKNLSAAWWIDSSAPLSGLDGESAQASIHAVMRSLLDEENGTPIDSGVAIGATMERSEQELRLGHVEYGFRKWERAKTHGCHTLVVHPKTAEDALKAVPDDKQANLPELKAVETFEKAWEELTGEARIFGARRDDVEQQWLEQWSRVIDGDTVTPIQRNEKTGKLELLPSQSNDQ